MRQIKSEIMDGKEVQTWEVRGGIIGFLEDVGAILSEGENRKPPVAIQNDSASEEKPVRLQRSRKKGWVAESPNGLPNRYVGRPSSHANNFPVGVVVQHPIANYELTVKDLEQSKRLFKLDLWKRLRENPLILESLRNCNLMCWCRPDAKWCHADTLLEIANEESA